MRSLVITTLVLCLALAGCTVQSPEINRLEGIAQGTTYHISWWTAPSVDKQQLLSAITQEFQRLDTLLSNYRPDSTISTFNANRTTETVSIDAELVTLIAQANQIHGASEGCYDPTIKPLFDLWGFTGDRLTVPNDEQLDQTLQQVGMEKLILVDAQRLKKSIPELQVDLSSIAQGYSVERIAQVLEKQGIDHYLVEIGGELKTRGHKPDDSPWRVAIERPLPGEQSLHKAITIGQDEPLAVMTSGTYRHFFDKDGQRYSHILDARTGRPVVHDLVSVTVLHPDPTLADAWSTALLCLGANRGVAVANKAGIAALFIRETDAGLIESRSEPLSALENIEVR